MDTMYKLGCFCHISTKIFHSKFQQQDRAENLVKVLGVIRGSENPSIFVPANDAETGQWFYIDVPSMAHSSGLPDHTIYIEDINEKKNAINPYPVPRDANSLIRSSVMPQDHLNYTFTWQELLFVLKILHF